MAEDRRASKTLSYWLRHNPGAAKLSLDEGGWTDVDAVLRAFGPHFDRERLLSLVEKSDKRRFELSADGSRIRARQGHSVQVLLDWPQVEPPELLYHGTVERFLPSILQGLKPMKRQHVHLSPDVATARAVGARRGKPKILAVKAAELAAIGQPFFLSSNDVWLTPSVPPAYLMAL